MADDRVTIGRVLGAHALKGWVRCRAGESLPELERVFVNGTETVLETVRPDKDMWLVKLAGCDDRNAAEAMAGAELSAPRDWLPEADDDEVYLGDLVGCTLVDLDGAVLGVVRATTAGAQERLECETPDGKPFSVPFVPQLVVTVDLPARRLTCDLPLGLIDLDQAESG